MIQVWRRSCGLWTRDMKGHMRKMIRLQQLHRIKSYSTIGYLKAAPINTYLGSQRTNGQTFCLQVMNNTWRRTEQCSDVSDMTDFWSSLWGPDILYCGVSIWGFSLGRTDRHQGVLWITIDPDRTWAIDRQFTSRERLEIDIHSFTCTQKMMHDNAIAMISRTICAIRAPARAPRSPSPGFIYF